MTAADVLVVAPGAICEVEFCGVARPSFLSRVFQQNRCIVGVYGRLPNSGMVLRSGRSTCASLGQLRTVEGVRRSLIDAKFVAPGDLLVLVIASALHGCTAVEPPSALRHSPGTRVFGERLNKTGSAGSASTSGRRLLLNAWLRWARVELLERRRPQT